MSKATFPTVLMLLFVSLLSLAQDGFELTILGPGVLQGEPFVVVFNPGKPAVTATGYWLGQTVSFDPLDDRLISMAAVDRGTKPGNYGFTINVTFADGSTARFEKELTVQKFTFEAQALSVDPRYVTLSQADLDWVAEDNRAAAEAYKTSDSIRHWTQSFAVPAEARWSSPFGVSRTFNGEERSYHSGSDLAVPTGTPIKASNAGRVALVRHMFFGGNTVLVDHGLGVFTGYMHLSEFSVKEGQMLERGDVVGLSGSTGRVTGPHLHWMLRVNDVKVNAQSLLAIDLDDLN